MSYVVCHVICMSTSHTCDDHFPKHNGGEHAYQHHLLLLMMACFPLLALFIHNNTNKQSHAYGASLKIVSRSSLLSLHVIAIGRQTEGRANDGNEIGRTTRVNRDNIIVYRWIKRLTVRRATR
jgi:hypothetical protein